MKKAFPFLAILAGIVFIMASVPGGLLLKTKVKSREAFKFCAENNFNTDFCILIDMSVHSGKNRLFVYDFKGDSIRSEGLCSHGCCDKIWGSDQTKEDVIFSNVSESHCSSIGKYKVGDRGYSSWGINVNYKLHGMDKTNSKAYDRLIVLHSWNMVPDNELYPEGTPEGWGCPAVSNSQMRYIDALLKKSDKPVLLWIYK